MHRASPWLSSVCKFDSAVGALAYACVWSQQKTHCETMNLELKKDWCGFSPPPPHLAFCGYFSWSFWQGLFVCVKLCHISLKFQLCVIQLGIRRGEFIIKLCSLFSKVDLLVWSHFNLQQLSQGWLSCSVCERDPRAQVTRLRSHDWAARDPALKSTTSPCSTFTSVACSEVSSVSITTHQHFASLSK